MKVFIHGGGDFGIGLHSTSHIESVWANLKKIITSLYGIMPKKNFILFLREAEFRYNIRVKNKDEIISLLKDIFKKIYDYNQFIIKNSDIF